MHRSYFKESTYRNNNYLQWVARQRCRACSCAIGIEAHHEAFGNRGVALKPPDTFTIPLCRRCHYQRHQQGFNTFWQETDVKLIIIQLLTQYMSEVQQRQKQKNKMPIGQIDAPCQEGLSNEASAQDK